MLVAAAASGVLAAAGCSLFRSPPPPPDPLEPLRTATAALLARYEQAMARHPELAERLGPVRDVHAAHLAALDDLLGGPATGGPVPADASPPAGEGPEAVLRGLREAEADAEREAAVACLAAPPERAFLLGAICAARAAHQVVLS